LNHLLEAMLMHFPETVSSLMQTFYLSFGTSDSHRLFWFCFVGVGYWKEN